MLGTAHSRSHHLRGLLTITMSAILTAVLAFFKKAIKGMGNCLKREQTPAQGHSRGHIHVSSRYLNFQTTGSTAPAWPHAPAATPNSVHEAALALIRRTLGFKSALRRRVAGEGDPRVRNCLRICSSYRAKTCGRNQAGGARLRTDGVLGIGVLVF